MSTISSAKTMYVNQDGPANALAHNKDYSQVVIAGRNVFKVFSIEEDGFVERYNLRVGKNLNLNFSCNDVVWSTLEEHLLATAATNGAVVVWNLNRPSRTKQEHVFFDHKRTVNKVSFHTTEPHLLISGSQDGTVKCFDLRSRESKLTFLSNSESVRDVQVSPQQPYTFASVSENGSVQLWDLRRADKVERQFTAHSGPVFACDWHPDTPWCLATAGRDKTIKVWELSGRPVLDHTIPTIASVGRIRWRPQRKYHIASCALVVDCSVCIWDVRRPFIPFAAFDEHKDVATGIAWRGDPHVFLTTSKDCTLYQHSFKDAIRPASKANPQGIEVSGKGHVCFATRSASGAAGKSLGLFRKTPNPGDLFCGAASSVQVFRPERPGPLSEQLALSWVPQLARGYLLGGRPFAEVCEHNASVARSARREQVAFTWQMLRIMYSGRLEDIQSSPGTTVAVTGTQDIVQDALEATSRHQSGSGDKADQVTSAPSDGTTTAAPTASATAASGGEDETETDEQDHQERSLATIASGLAEVQGQLFFGDTAAAEELLQAGGGFDYEALAALEEPPDWTLPSEAFQPRHEIMDNSPPPEQYPHRCSSPHLMEAAERSRADTVMTVEDQTAALLCVTTALQMSPWDPSPVVCEMLQDHAARGDVQTSVSALLVLGDRLGSKVDEVSQEHWFLSYVDLLHHFQLYDVATQVIRLCPLPSVHQLNQQSTTVHTGCGQCGKSLSRCMWRCDHCRALPGMCSLCHIPVRGLFAWCQGCGHGGHLAHMRDWFGSNRRCPTGCGHMCDYT